MKVCLHPNEGGQFLKPLSSQLKTYDNIEVVSAEGNIDACYGCDICHLNWPEALAGWSEPSMKEIDAIESKLKEIKKSSKVLCTVHNRWPHYKNTLKFRRLYQKVYSYVDVFVHMGKKSKFLLNEDYVIENCSSHVLIPHGVSYLKGDVSEERARKYHGVPKNRIVILSFGSIRGMPEIGLLFDGFKNLSVHNKYLLTAGKIRWPSKKKIAYYKHYYYSLMSSNISVNDRYVDDDKVQYFMNPAKVVVIPRVQGLNSGTVPLSFGFGKVVVGPSIGVIGEVLEKTNNPTFDPSSPKSLSKSLIKGINLSLEGHGIKNKMFASKKWQWKNVAKKYLDTYKQVLSGKFN